jgi:hypothetical protein
MPNQPDEDTVTVSFTLPRSLLQIVQQRATLEMTTQSDIIRRAMLNYLTPEEKKIVLSSLKAHGHIVINGSFNQIEGSHNVVVHQSGSHRSRRSH